MLLLLKNIFSGELVQEIINRFDPYHANELTKEQNKKENKNATLEKN